MIVLILTINHHHHHLAPSVRISLIVSCHHSLSSVACGRSSGLHPLSEQSCCMYLRAGHLAFALPCVGVHWSTSLMSLDHNNNNTKARKNQEKSRNLREKKLTSIWDIGSGHYQTSGNERDFFKKSTSEERGNYSKTNYITETSRDHS